MRIRRVNIESFGAVRDRSYSLSDGLNVLYGPNESGKTSTMEFIRTLLVPSTKKKLYPERRRGDSGTLIYEQDGQERVLRLTYRTVSGDTPRMPTGTDDQNLFRSVFAMTPSDLDDEKVVTEGGVKSRFLTVPGGDSMPEARAAAEDLWVSKLGKRSNSQSEVIELSNRLSALDVSIIEARRVTDEYGDLDARRAALEARVSELRERSSKLSESKRIHDIYESNRPNYERLEDLRRQRADIGDFVPVTQDDRARFANLKTVAEEKRAHVEDLSRRREEKSQALMGADRRRIVLMSQQIGTLPGKLEMYREDSEALRQAQSRRREHAEAPVPKESESTRGSVSGLLVAGAIIAVMGLVATALVSSYAITVTVVGIIVAAFGLRRPAKVPVASPQVQSVDDDGEVRELGRRTSAFESEVSAMMSELGLHSRGVEADVGMLTAVRDAAVAVSNIDNDLMRAKMDSGTAVSNLLRFTQRFAGEEGFEACSRKTLDAERIDGEISMLRDVIAKAGLDPDRSDCPVDYDGDHVSDEIEQASLELGQVNERMKGILDTEDIERMMDERAQIQAGLDEALDEGAVGLLATAIADRACEEIYSQVQPGVITTADRYLSMMTGGQYRIDTDPRSEGLSIRNGDEVKGITAWSSGLRAQALLAVKLAVAREMGGGEVPVILDDVLLPFDSDRKGGACRALAELAPEMQVLMFTCDAETVSICSRIPGVILVPMRRA